MKLLAVFSTYNYEILYIYLQLLITFSSYTCNETIILYNLTIFNKLLKASKKSPHDEGDELFYQQRCLMVCLLRLCGFTVCKARRHFIYFTETTTQKCQLGVLLGIGVYFLYATVFIVFLKATMVNSGCKIQITIYRKICTYIILYIDFSFRVGSPFMYSYSNDRKDVR